MNITVLGATGGIGHAITSELSSRGHDVTAASRSVRPELVPTGVRTRVTELRERDDARAACRGADVVVMAAQVPYPRWATELSDLFERAIDAASHAGARLVVVDNLYAYGSPGTPITDASAESATTRKGAIRRDLGRRLLDAHAAGRVPVAIGRFSDYYGGYGDNSLVVQLGIRRVLEGKAPQAFIAADEPHTFAYLPDAARGFATLVEDERADGRSWVLPATDAVTQRELYRTLCDVADAPVRLGRITVPMLWAAGVFDAQLREAREQVAQFDRPYATRADDFEATFGHLPVTDHREALAASLTAFRASEAVAA